jgi:Holliday junction resolvase RusA-like endonuclease
VTERVLEFTVAGKAATKGSGRTVVSKSTGRAIYLHDNPRTKDWQAAIGWSAAAAIRALGGGIPFPTGPVFMAVVFYLPRPKSLLTTRKAPLVIPHVKKPDVDKTLRAAFDSLSGIAWTDDSQVTDVIARKRYCAATEFPRAVIRVRAADGGGGLYARS